MTSLARPSSALLSRSTIRSSQLRRSLPSIYASSTADSSNQSMVVKNQQRFQSGTTMNHKSTTSTFTSFASRRMAQFRAFHGTPCLSDDAAAAPAEEASEGSSEPHPTEIEYAFTPPPPLSEESLQKVNGLFERILHLDMIEVHLLTMVVNEQLGLKWNQVPGAGAGPMGGGGGAAAAEEAAPEEKTLFDLKLVGFDAKAKIKVIKEVRSIAGLGLKEAKELVEGAPKVIQKDLKLDKAEELKALLEAAGAQVELS